jgi:ankyrin repeat protein
MVRLLIAWGAKVDSRFKGYVTPLHIAVEHHHFAAADVLVKAGAPISLHLAAALGDVSRLAQHLRTENADVQDPAGNTPLHYFAVGRGDRRVGVLLLAAGANVNARNHAGATPLHFAVRFQNRGATEFLMENGADPYAIDSLGNTLLSLAKGGADRKIQELVSAKDAK